ncbi:MAG: SAM-dependent DNA methyltransferase [Lachnospiraceae bacterium]|nr:SAM-dependent DNA methyltransferase [Lachnospiraceae bacterium]
MKKSEIVQGTEKEFMEVFKQLCVSRSSWQVWADLMSAMACSLSNVMDRTPEHYEAREKEYEECIRRLGSVEVPAKIAGIIVMALENNPDQDFLGEMFMKLNLGNHWKGQFFTPYSVCEAMAKISCGDLENQIREKGYISICDPACGAGATLIAAANNMKSTQYNFQNHAVFVGQDIDRVAGMMCYIQLSLIGCPGYVCIGNTLTNPLTGHVLFPQEKEGQELWYTPMFQSEIWEYRKIFERMKLMCGTATTKKTVEKERFYMFFDFEKKEVTYGRKEIGTGI